MLHTVTAASPTMQGIALRGLFIIDPKGVIQHATINNLAIGRSVDETLRTLQVGSITHTEHCMGDEGRRN